MGDGQGRSFHLREETVTSAGQSLDEARFLGRISQRFAQPIHCLVEALIEIDKGGGRPQPLYEIVATHQLAGTLEQGRQDLERFSLQFMLLPMADEFAGPQIELKLGEKNAAWGLSRRCHGPYSLSKQSTIPMLRIALAKCETATRCEHTGYSGPVNVTNMSGSRH